MTIDEIKSVSIVQFLETEGFQYAYIHRGNYWYLSPFRAESSPSFNVSPTKNLWNDFGANSGGNIINLVQKITLHGIIIKFLLILNNRLRATTSNMLKIMKR